MGFWPVVLSAIRNSDIVLLVVDARMVEETKNLEIISKVELMRGKRLFFVFNKIDLISRTELEKLKKENVNAFFVSGSTGNGILSLRKSLENMAENCNREYLRVSLVGYPNVGKSAVLNKLVPGFNAKVKAISGTTRKVDWVQFGKVKVMDSPGVIPVSDGYSKIGFNSSKDPHKLKNPERVVMKIIEYLEGRGGNVLNKFYGVSGELKGYDLLLEIGRKKGFLLRGGEVDERRAAILIILDWQTGKIRLK